MTYVNDPETLRLAVAGRKDAMEQVVCTNLGLVKSIALRFVGRGVELEDLIQIGTVGMIKAIRGFDPEKECRFTTYAVPLIMGEIKRFLRDDGPLKVGREIKRNGHRIRVFCEEYEKKTGQAPTVEIICRETGLTEEDAVLAMEASRPTVSLFSGEEEGGVSLLDTVGEDSMEKAVMGIALREAVTALPEEERKLICLRYFKSLTQAQTARILGMTQVKVSREEKRIIGKLRASFLD